MINKLDETGIRTVACVRAVLEGASNFLRDGVTLNGLQQEAQRLTDIEAARQVREAREAMLKR
ncbi:hypothetical protein OKW50_004424 [Paraburkholderia youngii]|uniref:Uncharacterized protein n=1 Tax=Paraburkholderia youngii TaxID=2782701 RepID=A0ABX2NUQ6_9BURK|nr:hypothetical protein [Paraburkholderia youngii]NVI07936.1 hypothetical protein [Paraburkholderia youngii]